MRSTMNTLSGLRSRWTICRLWAACRALAICTAMLTVRAASKRFSRWISLLSTAPFSISMT